MISKGLTRFGLVAAVAALMLTLGMAMAETASAQTPPAVFYGKGLTAGARVEAMVGGRSCGTATANAAGEWSISVASNAACAPTEGAAVSFTLNGAAATSTPAATWRGGGLPPDVANGYVLAAGGAGTVTPPKTGSAGMLGMGTDATSGMLVLALAVLAAGTVAGARVYAGRGR